MSEHGESDTVMENSETPMKIESNMKCGWCQTVNNTVCYCQTPHNIAVILEQVTNYNALLRETMSMKKTTWKQQKNATNEDNSSEVKLRATAKEHVHNVCEKNKKDVERNETEIENAW